MTAGLIAQKIGMTRILTNQGDHIPVTLFIVENCEITSIRTRDKNGYEAVQVGVGHKKSNRTSKPLRGQFKKLNIEAKRKVAEFRFNLPDSIFEENLLKYTKEISSTYFTFGQYVDITGKALGKGFTGPMKRYGFSGLGASHGVSASHRSHGSVGSSQDPGRVLKGKKMAGHMGTNRVTIQNLYVVSMDLENGIIVVKGSVPGPRGEYVLICDAVKKRPRKNNNLSMEF